MLRKKTPQKNLTEEVYGIIRNDIPLRHKIASAIGVEASSVYGYAKRKSPGLSKPFIVDLIADHLGKAKEEILIEH